MKISVITVCRNASETIAGTLESVVRQTYPHVEHVVIDGASSDGTMAVVRHYGHYLAHSHSAPDRGIYDAMNKGLAVASGDVIGFLNADDAYAHSNVLANVMNLMQAEDLDAVYGDVVFFHSDRPHQLVRRYRSSRFRPSRIAWGWMPAHPALFLHRRVFERVGQFSTDYQIAGDFEFVARAFHAGGLRYRHTPEVLVRMRTGGISTGSWRNTLLLNREVLRACRQNGIYTNPLMILAKYPHKLLEFVSRTP